MDAYPGRAGTVRTEDGHRSCVPGCFHLELVNTSFCTKLVTMLLTQCSAWLFWDMLWFLHPSLVIQVSYILRHAFVTWSLKQKETYFFKCTQEIESAELFVAVIHMTDDLPMHQRSKALSYLWHTPLPRKKILNNTHFTTPNLETFEN